MVLANPTHVVLTSEPTMPLAFTQLCPLNDPTSRIQL